MLLLVEVVVGKLVIYLLLLNRQDLLYLLMMYLPLLLPLVGFCTCKRTNCRWIMAGLDGIPPLRRPFRVQSMVLLFPGFLTA
uniref:Uncharacterized protein n=2 Tax=Picea TaxID=3328 RepID=A0A101M174_PICGL|nr:hypothetical protein ABT39_MTgene3708 [Picea glauca]QHR90300.1 hypothetical protein Q903MT_gene4323 [Picea sitchensis]